MYARILKYFYIYTKIKISKNMYSVFVYVYLRRPQTTHESFIYGCPSTVVKNLLLYLKADYRKSCLFLSYSPLPQLKIWEQD